MVYPPTPMPKSFGQHIVIDSDRATLKDHIFERRSVAVDHDVLTEALRHGRGRINHQGLKDKLNTEEFAGAILRDGNQVATRENLIRERQMIDVINSGI